MNQLIKFRIAIAFFVSYFAIPFTIGVYWWLRSEASEYNQLTLDYDNLVKFSIAIFTTLYFIWEIRKSNINYRKVLGSRRSIDLKLPVALAFMQYLFTLGSDAITLYGLSFIYPDPVRKYINLEYADTTISWIFLLLSALIFAPVFEEFFFRGIVFQKIASQKGFFRGLIISVILFVIIHLRFTVISLSVAGIITTLLYWRTKQLSVAIIYHFFYNLFFSIGIRYSQLKLNFDPSTQTTIAEFQQQVSDRMELYILLLAVSVPYLCYFIYKNYPRHYSVDKLPYFANQKTVS